MKLFTPQEQQNLAAHFPEFSMLFQETLDSTQSECQRQWVKNPSVRWLVVANHQTNGRGRYGHQWQSPAYVNLYVSWIQPNPYKNQIGLLNLLCGILIYRSLKPCLDFPLPELTLKWPNDMYYADKKLAGLLLQNLDADFSKIIVGIGINITAQKNEIPETATSLALIGANPQDDTRSKILHHLLTNFRDPVFAEYTPDKILDEFAQCSQRTREHFYSYSCYQYYYKGKLQELHPNGTATIITDHGQIVHLTS